MLILTSGKLSVSIFPIMWRALQSNADLLISVVFVGTDSLAWSHTSIFAVAFL